MSFKMEFVQKMFDQFRGLFQNQKANSSNTISDANTISASTSTRPKSPSTTLSKLTSVYPDLETTTQPKSPNSNKMSVCKTDLCPKDSSNCNPSRPPILPPSSLSFSNWSVSPGTPGGTGNNAGSPYNYYASHSSQSNAHQMLYNYHHSHHHPQAHSSNNNNNNQSSSSSSTSFGAVPLTPSSVATARGAAVENTISGGPHSFSAINTPDSPVNFRRQHSLNVNQRNQASSRPLLDLRSQKNSSLYAKQSASTDLIDKHSLSPRPRPKDLSLSNSQDNILKGHFNQMDGSGSSRFDAGHHQHHPNNNAPNCKSQIRPGGLFPNMNFDNHKNGNKAGSSSRSPYYPKGIELSRNSSSLNIDGKTYDNLKESDFKKISQLGSGSFGQVDKMLHKLSNTELAVKKMRRSGSSDDNRHVQRDLELLQKCNYRHVVQCYGYFILETEVWIFMELMSTCFDHLIKKLAETNETVPEKIIGKVAVATIDTLDYLKKEHSAIHRDIKPSNILINTQGIIKLCDFGISGSLVNSKAHTRSIGSTAYMAPERIEPPPDGTYDVRSDIWSMGITLVEIATGQFPYKNWSTDFEILSKVIQEEPPTLPDDRDFSDDFRKFIKACLIKNSTLRPKYGELMKFPFYQYYKTANVDVAEWFKQAYCDTNCNNNTGQGADQPNIANNRSQSSSASSLASNSTVK